MAELAKFERKIIDDVDEFGVSTVGVFDPDGDNPHFRYSVGFLHSYDQPECIILGLDLKLMHNMINALNEQLKDGFTLDAGTPLQGLLGGGFTCLAMPVSPQHLTPDYFNSAMWFNRHSGGADDSFRAMQIVWPGASNGLYPWQNEDVSALQPLLCDRPMSA